MSTTPVIRTRVKICGVTRVEDAIKVVNSGADAIGLVFYPPSPRAVDMQQAADIAAVIPAFVTVTALFVNPTVEQVQSVLDAVSTRNGVSAPTSRQSVSGKRRIWWRRACASQVPCLCC